MSLDLGPAIRTALIEATDISGELDQWNGEPAIFTRRPLPESAPDKVIIINPPAAITDADGLSSDRPIPTIDVAVYGNKGTPGTEDDHTRTIEALGFAIRELFHRQRFSVRPAGFHVIGVTASGPTAAPVDDESTIGRVVSLTIRLRREL